MLVCSSRYGRVVHAVEDDDDDATFIELGRNLWKFGPLPSSAFVRTYFSAGYAVMGNIIIIMNFGRGLRGT